jgi:hypothetical protein
MKRKIRLQTDTELIKAEVVTPFESAVDGTGAHWRYHGLGARGHLWQLVANTRPPSGARGHPRTCAWRNTTQPAAGV